VTIIQLAEAVKDDLNAQVWSPTFTAVRKAIVENKLADMDTLHVSVVPRSIAPDVVARARIGMEMGVDIGVQQRTSTPGTDAAILTLADSLTPLVQAIAKYMTGKDYTESGAKALWQETTVEPLWDPEHLRTLRQFTGVVRVTWREIQTT